MIAPMIVHFLYNIFGLFGQPYVSRLYVLTGNMRLSIFLACFVFLLSLVLFSGVASRLYRKYLRDGLRSNHTMRPVSVRHSVLEIVKDPYAVVSVSVYIIAVFISLIFGGR